MRVQIHRLPEISVDRAMVIMIIRTSVSSARMIAFSENDIYDVHVAAFLYQPLPDCTQDLQLTRWNHK